jgi:hypothetical protein
LDGAQPPPVTFVDPAHQRVFGFGLARQDLVEHVNDVAQ